MDPCRDISLKCRGNTVSGRDVEGHMTSSLTSENGASRLNGGGDGIKEQNITTTPDGKQANETCRLHT